MGTYYRTALMGDLNRNGGVTTADAILALKTLAGGATDGVGPGELDSRIDVNGDGRVGSAEAVYVLQKAAEMRSAADGLLYASGITSLQRRRWQKAGGRIQ